MTRFFKNVFLNPQCPAVSAHNILSIQTEETCTSELVKKDFVFCIRRFVRFNQNFSELNTTFHLGVQIQENGCYFRCTLQNILVLCISTKLFVVGSNLVSHVFFSTTKKSFWKQELRSNDPLDMKMVKAEFSFQRVWRKLTASKRN